MPTAVSDVVLAEVAASLRAALVAYPVGATAPRDKPARYRLEGALIFACLLAGIDPLDNAPGTPSNAEAVADAMSRLIPAKGKP